MNTRRAPGSAFARLICPMSVRSSAETQLGLPTRLRDRQRQYVGNPARCQRMMVIRPDDHNTHLKEGRKPAIEPNK